MINLRGGLALLFLLSACGASAARPDARVLTCAEVQAVLAASGAATISTGAHLYDRYVAGPGHCFGTSVARPTLIATKDFDACEVYHCESRVQRNNR